MELLAPVVTLKQFFSRNTHHKDAYDDRWYRKCLQKHFAEIIAIRKNKKRADTKDIKDHVIKNFTTDAEEELTEGIVMELLKDIMENGPTTKGRFWWLFYHQKKWYLQGIQVPQATNSGLTIVISN